MEKQEIKVTGICAFDIIAKIHRIALDINAIVRKYALDENEIPLVDLLRIIKDNEFKAKVKNQSPDEIEGKYPLPAIIIRKDGTYDLLLKINKEKCCTLVYEIKTGQTKELSFDEIQSLCGNNFIILTHKLINSQIMFGFKWFFYEILNYKQVIGEVMLGSFIVQLFALVTPLFTQVILDKVIVHRSMQTLDVLAFAFVAVMIFELLLNFSRKYIFLHTACKIDAKLGSKLFRHLFSLPFVYFENRKVGNIITRVRELDQIRDFITNKSVSVILDVFFSFVFVIMMFLYSKILTSIAVLFVAIIAVLYLIITPELRSRLETKFQTGAQSNSYLVESVTGIQTVKSLSIEGSMQKKWEDYLAKYISSSFKLSNMSNISSAISQMLQKGMTIAILYFGVKLVIDNKLTIGQLIAFQMFANQFSGPVLRLVNLWNEFQEALLGVDRLGDILNNPPEIQSNHSITLPKLSGNVRFDKVCFKYLPNSPLVVNNFTFDVKPGMSIGIVGRSGSGKSTITKLIQRMYLINEGAIYIDGIDIRQMNPLWLRHNIGVVLQENYLFSGTIRENIILPKPDAPIELVIQAAKIAGAHEFIQELPEGYETFVGERGSTLSGGQKQRIAIARALITNPKIFIMDEATSALDYESERTILNNMDKIVKGRTTFIIAHRLSTVQNCDKIIVMDKGRIIEIGNHNELMSNKNGYYHYLYSQQGLINA